MKMSSENMVLRRNICIMDTSHLEKWNCRGLCVGSTHINHTIGGEGKKSRKQCDAGMDRGSESREQEKG